MAASDIRKRHSNQGLNIEKNDTLNGDQCHYCLPVKPKQSGNIYKVYVAILKENESYMLKFPRRYCKFIQLCVSVLCCMTLWTSPYPFAVHLALCILLVLSKASTVTTLPSIAARHVFLHTCHTQYVCIIFSKHDFPYFLLGAMASFSLWPKMKQNNVDENRSKITYKMIIREQK